MRPRHLLVFLAAAAACNSNTTVARYDAAVGATGGTASGGTVATGGSAATGGIATGGITGTGGTMQGGGATGGGTIATGGGIGRDAGADMMARRDGALGGSPGSGGVGAGGARVDAGLDLVADTRPDVFVSDTRSGADVPVGGGSDATTRDGAPCPYTGNVTYTLSKNADASAAEQAAYPLMTKAMDEAVYYYNCYTNISKKVTVTYNASVDTVDGNINGSIRFGSNTSYMEYTRAMHEISHTVGVGTASNWMNFLPTPAGGGTRVWTGTNATAELRAITGVPTDVIKGDTQHFWPNGLNYASEVKSEADVINHCRIVMALRKDMGMQ